MLNDRQIDLGEKLLVNSANVILATLILGHILILVIGAFWLRKGNI